MLETVPTTEPTAEVNDSAYDERIETRESRARKYRETLVEKQRGQGKRLKDFLKDLRDHYANLDADARLKRAVDTDLMIRYLNGDHYGEHNAQGVWERYTLNDGDFAYTIPVLVGHVEQALSQMLKTRVEYEFEAKGAGSPADRRSVARMSTELANEEMERLFDEDTRQDEILNTLVAGESPRYLYWGPSGRRVKKPMYRLEKMTLGARRECGSCKAEVGPELKECPKCGVSYVKEIAGGETTKTVGRGSTFVEQGHNCLHVPPPLGVQYDLSARSIHESAFVVERDTLPLKSAEWTYKTHIEVGKGLSEEMRIRREQERMSVQTDATVGTARQGDWGFGGRNEQVERVRHFVEPSEYGWFYLDQEETLPDGKKLSSGKLLGEHYPEGMYFNFVGDTLVEVEKVQKNRKWSLVRYGKRAGTNRGTGMQIGIPAQDILDDSFNLTYSTGMTVGHPLTIVNRKWAKELPDANNMLFVSGDVDINNVATRISGSAGSSVVDATAQRVEAALQFILGTQSVAGIVGAPDARAAMGTATGIAATVENAALRMAGPIGQRVAADKELRVQILENIKDHSSPEQIKELERRYGPDTVKAFLECDFRLDLVQRVIPNTDRPRSTALTQATLMALGQMAPGLAQVPWGGELLSLMGEVAGVPLEVGPGRSDRREAEHRLNKLDAIVEGARKKNPAFFMDAEKASNEMYELLARFCGPLILTEGDSLPSLFMQEHATFMDVYKDALFSEEARTWEQAQRLTVIRLWSDHFRAQMRQQVETAKLKKGIQDEIEPPPEGPSPEDVVMDRGANLLEEAAKREADEEAKDADLGRDMARAEHQKQLEEGDVIGVGSIG